MLDVIEHPLHIVLIRGTSTVRINVLIRNVVLLLALKLLLNKLISRVKVSIRSSIVREAVRQRLLCNLVLEQIPFVQKEYKRRGQKPPRITNLLKETQCL